MKKSIYICASLSTFCMFLTGCFPVSNQSGVIGNQSGLDYISIEEAKKSALADANISDENVVFSQTDLGDKNGVAYYEIDFQSNGVDYEYDIDAISGNIIEKSQNGNVKPQIPSATVPPVENNKNVGEISDTDGNALENQSGLMTEEQVKKIALNHAGVNEVDVTFTKVKLYYDDDYMTQTYALKFILNGNTLNEYYYEVNAKTGEIIKYDHDNENAGLQQVQTPAPQPAQTPKSATKTEQEIRKIALAKVPGATSKDIRMHIDYDDGVMQYEGKIIYNAMEYDFEIDAYSGAILSWEAESVYDD